MMRQGGSISTLPRAGFVVVSLFAGLVVYACSSGPEPPAPSATGETAGPSTGAVSLPPGITQSDFTIYIEQANDFVRPIIEDGQVTAAEYERAIFRTMQCLDEHGVPHSQPELEERLDGARWRYTVGPSSDADVERHTVLHDECDTAFLRTVASFWGYQHQPTESEIQERDEDYLACLRGAGIEVASADEARLRQREGLIPEDEMIDYIRCRILAYQGVDIGPGS